MGCQRMGAVTYPNLEVASFIEERFVPVKLHVVDDEATLQPFAVPWTPALFVLDAGRRQHRRIIGFHDPDDVIAELALGWTVAAIEEGDFAEAQGRVQVALERARHDRERLAEARYWQVVIGYKLTHDGLIVGWRKLVDELPGTHWARKVEPFVDED
jgi:hypothetical protein